MTSTKQSIAITECNHRCKTTVPASESLSTNSQSVGSKNMDNVAKVSEDTDRNLSSPSKTADPARKKTFKIISMKKGGSGDIAVDNDGDSMDGLDESQTEDLSSEFYDSSKATDIDQEIQDNMIPLTPDEVTSTTTVVIKHQKPDRESQSRFKVVKIETKEPFRRGKWICYDFFDSAPVAEKIITKVPDDSQIHSDMSSSISSSVQLVQNMKDSSNDIIVPLTSGVDGKTRLTDIFAPIEPAPSSLILNHTDSSFKDNLVPFTLQQPVLDAAGVLTSSTSYQNIVHQHGQGQTTLVQSLPQTNIFPYTQNAPGSLYHIGQNAQAVKVTLDSSTLIVTSSQATINQTLPSVATSYSTAHGNSSLVSQNSEIFQSGVTTIPRSQSQGQLSNAPQTQQKSQTGSSGSVVDSQNLGLAGANNSMSAIQGGITLSSIPVGVGVNDSSIQDSVTDSGNVRDNVNAVGTGMLVDDASILVGIAMDESIGSTKTIQGDMTSQLPSGGLEEVMAIDLDTNPEEEMDENGTSTVAIDNKIEQAMDLVKRHLMYAVREEVEILKQQIGELMERIGQLEFENTILRSEALPETLNKLITAPRNQAKQPPQPTATQQQQQQSQVNIASSGLGQMQTQPQSAQQQNALSANIDFQGRQQQPNLNQQIQTNLQNQQQSQQSQNSNSQLQPLQQQQQQQSASGNIVQNANYLSHHSLTTTTMTATTAATTTTASITQKQQQEQQQTPQPPAS